MKNFATLAFASVVAATSIDENDLKFMQFIAEHGRSYESMEEYSMRKTWFLKTDAVINHLNSSQTSSRHGHNKFSDLTDDEWKGYLLNNFTPSDPSKYETYTQSESSN
jgi:hypothetical protein